MRLDVLVIAAHRDDAEIVCGGTIIKFVDQGYAVGILDLTAGEAGTRGDSQLRAEEAQAASKIMGITFRENLELPDAGLFLTQENALKVAETIRLTAPQLVILPYWIQRHPDHSMAAEIGYRGCFLAGLEKMPIPGTPFRPRKIIYATSFHDIESSYVTDITEQFERKCQAVACYKSQFEELPGVREVYPPAKNIFDYMEIKNRQYGYQVNVKYGECFIQKEKMLINDLLKLPGKSI